MKKNFSIIFVIVILLSCKATHQTGSNPPETMTKPTSSGHPKNIILLIGDGMGITQITAGLYSNGNQLNLEKFKHIGLHKTYSSDDLITDSAAGATAFSAGVKTYNGAIGVDADTLFVPTILEEAEQHHKSTGLVATSTIVHATPASFIAHQKSRRMYEAIASDFLKTDIDVFIGGGKKFFDRRESDNRNLLDELKQNDYLVKDYFNSNLKDIRVKPNQKIVYLTADEDPIPVAQGRDYLEEASMLAINQLSNNSKDGFFLMIEGSQIDWGGHANKSDYIVSEFLEFDTVIGRVLDWAMADKNTLVIVTADHETGGYAINGGTMDSLETAFTSTYHTADLIPVFAYGPGSEAFNGIYENTAIYHKMRAAFRFNNP